MALIMKMFIVP